MELLKRPILRVPLLLVLTGILCRTLRYAVIMAWTRVQMAQGPDPVTGAYEVSVGPAGTVLDLLCFALFWIAGWLFVRGLTRKQIFCSATIMAVWLGVLLAWEQLSQALGGYSIWVHRLYATQEAVAWATQLLVWIFDEVSVPVVLPSILTPYLYLLLGKKAPKVEPDALEAPGGESSRARKENCMRRRIFWMLCLLATILLTACGGGTNPNLFEKDGYTVDREAGTITHGEDVYTYEISGGGSSSTIRITYPNGAAYHWTWSGNSGYGSGGWSDDYDPARYADGDTLMELVNFQPPRESSGSPLLGLLAIAVGIFNLAVSRTAWYLSYGWRFKDAEPSDAALALGRLGGGIAVFAGLLLFFL